jgi:hypothetical protein
MSLKMTVAPTGLVVNLEEVKGVQPSIEHDADDGQLTRLIKAATRHVEAVTWRQFLTATYVLKLRDFPWGQGMFGGPGDHFVSMGESGSLMQMGHEGFIHCPRPPLQAVTSLTYVDWNGNTQTQDPSTYTVDPDTEPGTIEPVWGSYWPPTRWVPGAVTVTFTAGYGDTAESVSEPLRDSIIRVVRACYDQGSSFDPKNLPLGMSDFLEDYKFRDARILESVR